MTSTADMTQHPDVSEISDLAEGLLPPARSVGLRQHLDDCALCADVHASLEEIRGLLGTLPGATRMPADISERIDAALAAEALLNSTAPDHHAHVSRETTSVLPRQEPRPADRPSGQARGKTGPGRGRMGKRRRTAALGAVFALAAVGMSVLLLQTVQSTNNAAAEKKDAATDSAAAGGAHDFAGPELESTVRSLIGDGSSLKRSVPESDGFQTKEAPTPPRALKSTQVPVCIQKGTGRLDDPIASEQGTHHGTQAYLVVFPHTSDPAQVEAYVVDAACVDSSSSAAGKLLLEKPYPRP
ncbi:anti-sigma factor family protein [Streptomyces albipurpureus]|uniref:Zinc-finger domain-containing protein n=1 Tax=Streptomyces albipurpureus TaxID=2897419 RepID=A0ABT0USF7_9ACTN|nr:hypothetical protein [Streptomyces sp. CWNU-1]MCM2391488.1 hypothetical protein [Streptomyces sp. CWNU-1]